MRFALVLLVAVVCAGVVAARSPHSARAQVGDEGLQRLLFDLQADIELLGNGANATNARLLEEEEEEEWSNKVRVFVHNQEYTNENDLGLLGKYKDGVARFYNVPFGKISQRWLAPEPLENTYATSSRVMQARGVTHKYMHHHNDWFKKGTNTSDMNFLSGIVSSTACYQFLPGVGHFGVDQCLMLDIAAPVTPCEYNADPATDACVRDWEDKDLLPVLVFIHGGAFVLGDKYQNRMYAGHLLAKDRNIVVVNIQYRLGPLGFLAHPALPSSNTNAWFLDQQLALQWVQENIALFGGDASRVVVAGESAGAMSTCFHVANLRSQSYFSAAFMMSGNCDTRIVSWNKNEAHAHGTSYIDAVWEHTCKTSSCSTPVSAVAGCADACSGTTPNPDPTKRSLRCIADLTVPPECVWLNAFGTENGLFNPSLSGLVHYVFGTGNKGSDMFVQVQPPRLLWSPIIDPDSVIPVSALAGLAMGIGKYKLVVAGFNHDEGTLFTRSPITQSFLDPIEHVDLRSKYAHWDILATVFDTLFEFDREDPDVDGGASMSLFLQLAERGARKVYKDTPHHDRVTSTALSGALAGVQDLAGLTAEEMARRVKGAVGDTGTAHDAGLRSALEHALKFAPGHELDMVNVRHRLLHATVNRYFDHTVYNTFVGDAGVQVSPSYANTADAVNKVMRDYLFACPTLRMGNRAQWNGVKNTFLYKLNYHSRWMFAPGHLGTHHMAELPFLFGTAAGPSKLSWMGLNKITSHPEDLAMQLLFRGAFTTLMQQSPPVLSTDSPRLLEVAKDPRLAPIASQFESWGDTTHGIMQFGPDRDLHFNNEFRIDTLPKATQQKLANTLSEDSSNPRATMTASTGPGGPFRDVRMHHHCDLWDRLAVFEHMAFALTSFDIGEATWAFLLPTLPELSASAYPRNRLDPDVVNPVLVPTGRGTDRVDLRSARASTVPERYDKLDEDIDAVNAYFAALAEFDHAKHMHRKSH